MIHRIFHSLFATFTGAVAVLAMYGCAGKSSVSVKSVSVQPRGLTLEIGESASLVAAASPAEAEHDAVKWSSEDEKVATVDGKGRVTAVAAGSTKILAGCGTPVVYGLCRLTVTPGVVPDPPVGDPLTKAEAEQARLDVIAEWKSSQKDGMQEVMDAGQAVDNGHIMKFLVDCYGDEPKGGHSLWISLHGGGGVAASENDGQWQNQQVMYRRANPKQPAEGYYVSPRAYDDVWNMWFLRGNDPLFEQIIRSFVVLKGVNPDKVYLMGYSAGGDGVWRMAPRLADHWAAASMMAGHPGSTRFENLRNLPFMMWVGGNDTAYDRNTIVPETSRKIDALQAADPEGYIHECHVQKGRPHWMELDDAAAFPWMAEYTRNSYPKRIVWRQEAEEKQVPRPCFYWLKVAEPPIPDDESSRKPYWGKELVAEIKGNVVNIEKCDYSTFTIYLNDSMVDLDKEVTVTYRDGTLFKGKVVRSADVLRKTMTERNDPSYCFPAEIVVTIK